MSVLLFLIQNFGVDFFDFFFLKEFFLFEIFFELEFGIEFGGRSGIFGIIKFG